MTFFQITQRHYLRHLLQHNYYDMSCQQCMKEADLGLEPAAVRLEASSRASHQRKAIEVDVFVEAIDAAIEYKQVGQARLFKYRVRHNGDRNKS